MNRMKQLISRSRILTGWTFLIEEITSKFRHVDLECSWNITEGRNKQKEFFTRKPNNHFTRRGVNQVKLEEISDARKLHNIDCCYYQFK